MSFANIARKGEQQGRETNSYGSDVGPNPNAAYKRCVNSISSSLRQYQQTSNQVEKFSRSLGTNSDTHELRQRIQGQIGEANRIAQDINDNLAELSQYIEGIAPRESSTRRAQRDKLVRDFQSLVGKFQNVVKIVATKEKQSIKVSRETYVDVDADIESPDETDGLIQHAALESDIDFNNSLIAQREEEFLEINEAVGEVNAIYRDIAMLVNEQGAMIDTIESQVEDSRDATKKGVGELQSAGKHAKGSGNRLWCILFIVILVLAAILLYLFVLKQ